MQIKLLTQLLLASAVRLLLCRFASSPGISAMPLPLWRRMRRRGGRPPRIRPLNWAQQQQQFSVSKKYYTANSKDIKNAFGSDWDHIGTGRDDGDESGEYNPILYRKDRLNLVYSEQKWLSPSPDTPSYGWGGGSRRIVVIGVFEDIATGRRFMHANTHLDNVASEARVEGIKVVLSRIEAVQDLYGPIGVTLTGDFNSDPNGDAYKTLQNLDYFTAEIWDSGAQRLGTNQLTYTGFSDTGISRIDFIWLGGPNQTTYYSAQKFQILGNKASDGVYMSDHREVYADITLL